MQAWRASLVPHGNYPWEVPMGARLGTNLVNH